MFQLTPKLYLSISYGSAKVSHTDLSTLQNYVKFVDFFCMYSQKPQYVFGLYYLVKFAEFSQHFQIVLLCLDVIICRNACQFIFSCFSVRYLQSSEWIVLLFTKSVRYLISVPRNETPVRSTEFQILHNFSKNNFTGGTVIQCLILTPSMVALSARSGCR